MPEKKPTKVRTSITIDPELLTVVRQEAPTSVSAYIEEALRFYRAQMKEVQG